MSAAALWETSLTLFRKVSDAVGISRVVANLGVLRYDLGDDEAAVAALTEGLDLQRQYGYRQGMADNLLNLGMVYTRQHRYVEAESAFAEARAIYQDAGDRAGIGNTCLHMAHLARDQQQLDRAAHLYAASLGVALELGDRPRLPPSLEGIAHVLLRRHTTGRCERSVFEICVQLFACAAALRESTGVPLPTTSQRVYLPDLQQLQILLNPAVFEVSWRTGWEMPVLSLIERIPT